MKSVATKNILFLISILVSANAAWSEKSNRVALRAEASKEYTLARARDESAKGQTYHLIEGKYFGGNVADESMDEMSFQDIAEQLALNLQRQNYFSEEDPKAGDLLIMVHYGASNFISEEDDAEAFDIGDYLPAVRKANGGTYEYELSKNAIPKFWGQVLPADRPLVKEQYFRARILGMDDIFSSKVTSYEAFVQSELAAEGRYFIILTAFDLPLLKQGEKKVLWTTRYSIRAIGQSYDEAIQELNTVAGHYFGKNMKGLVSKRASDESLVEMGEIEVIENDQPSPTN
jgi:hypothetical protein